LSGQSGGNLNHPAFDCALQSILRSACVEVPRPRRQSPEKTVFPQNRNVANPLAAGQCLQPSPAMADVVCYEVLLTAREFCAPARLAITPWLCGTSRYRFA
jgi:hypothetical protein